MFKNWPPQPQATVIPPPQRNWRSDPSLPPRIKLRVEIERLSRDLYERNSDLLSDQLFLSEVHEIKKRCAGMKGAAIRMWGLKSTEYLMAERLIDQNETNDLTRALAAWKRERDREINADETEVVQLAAE